MKKNKTEIKEEEKKLTIYEYEQKYSKGQSTRAVKLFLSLFVAAIGVLIFVLLFLLTLKVWETINEYAGYAVGGVCLILFVVLYIVPVCKIFKLDYFMVNVNAKTAKTAQKHNRRVRREIADKMIDFTARVEGAGWYDSAIVGNLAIAVKANDEKGIMQSLTALYTGSVKKSANSMITKYAFKSAMYSALSQTNRADALLVAFINLQLIKDIVFLYGFRPSDAKLVRIFGRVLQNSMIAYGLGNVKIGNSIAKTMGDAVRGIPLLGSAISALVDSSVQGLTNGVLTAVIGYQTIKYLNEEYRLQEILDGIEIVETEEELRETCEYIAEELRSGKKKPA